MKKNQYAVILAGGSGTRFWPLSRKTKPKQFLNIVGKDTLFEETINRLKGVIDPAHIFIVTNAQYRREIEQQIKRFRIPSSHVLLEPQGKNTAPAILWASLKIHSINPHAMIAVLPSDHLILNRREFHQALAKAFHLASLNYLVTLGIVPTRPETGYGYLKTATVKNRGEKIARVAQFVEKPKLAKAKEFIKNKNYLWNSGMFFWKTSVVLDSFRKYLPQMYYLLAKSPSDKHVHKVWARLPGISIDYGILEKSDNVVTVPAANIGWSDLGSWQALTEVLPSTGRGNIVKGKVVELHCENSLVWGSERLVAAVGLKDMIVIDTPDAVLICHKESSQIVKDVVSILHKQRCSEV